jgi:hypothetical protein
MRNHFRLWQTPMTREETPVWIGQISRDIEVRFTRRTITTHKIDPNVDETREFPVRNPACSEMLSKFADVGGVGASTLAAPEQNLTGDPYHTDGLRAALWIAPVATDIDEIDYLEITVPAQ